MFLKEVLQTGVELADYNIKFKTSNKNTLEISPSISTTKTFNETWKDIKKAEKTFDSSPSTLREQRSNWGKLKTMDNPNA